MSYRAQDIVPISEARARLNELSDEVVNGAEKLLTKNGSAYVALVDARLKGPGSINNIINQRRQTTMALP